MRRHHLSLLALAIGLTASCAVTVEARRPAKYFAEYVATLKRLMEADTEMYRQVQIVSRKMRQFYDSYGHFPSSEEEYILFRKVCGNYIVGNPYQPKTTSLYDGTDVPAPYAVPIHFLMDRALSKENIAKFMKDPPPSWQGEPGSMFVMTNGINRYLIWSASADRLPMRDCSLADRPPRMIAGRVVRKVQ